MNLNNRYSSVISYITHQRMIFVFLSIKKYNYKQFPGDSRHWGLSVVAREVRLDCWARHSSILSAACICLE